MASNNSILYLLEYNNYFNRIVKKEESLSDYINNYLAYDPLVCSFNPADGIDTQHEFNVPYVANTPEADYAIVVDANTNEIVSRWFIVNATRTRGGQYTLSLHRDLMVDFYEQITNSPCYIEKATIPTIDSPLIFNSENFLCNQIKKGETLLKDKTGCGWLVGYVSTQSFPNDINVSIPASATSYPAPPVSYDTLINYQSKGVYKNEDGFIVEFVGAVGGGIGSNPDDIPAGQGWALTANVNGDTWARNIPSPDYYSEILFNVGKTTAIRNQTMAAISSRVIQQQDSLRVALYSANEQAETRVQITPTDYDLLLGMNGQTYSDGSNIFTVTVSAIGVEKRIHNNITASTGAAYSILKDIVDDYSERNPYHDEYGSGIRYEVYVDRLNISINASSVPAVTALIKNSVSILRDAPYRMFACPVGEPTTTLNGVDNISTLNKELSKNLCSSIATLLGGTDVSFIYDLQYLPYCPAREFLDESGRIVLGRGEEGIDYTLVKSTTDDSIVQYLLWCNNSNFTFTINQTISVPASVVDFKVAHETQFCRLVSPNYNGAFEFKPTANYGISGFEVNCTYRPFQPYIHLNPIFNEAGLYGGDYNDQRGLVCSGNFSIDIVNNNWIDYQIANKSYADAFNRQIENIETSFNLQKAQQKEAGQIAAMTMAITSGTTGAMLGGMIGGGLGAGIGGLGAGLIGGALSEYGLKKDLQYAQALQDESRNYAKDVHNMSLQNIMALPYTLGRVSAFTQNNKIFPFVEFYDATEEEKSILRNKLYFDGMTVGQIGSITTYINGVTPSFISAQLLRLEGVVEDYHCASAISNELHKGVYI